MRVSGSQAIGGIFKYFFICVERDVLISRTRSLTHWCSCRTASQPWEPTPLLWLRTARSTSAMLVRALNEFLELDVLCTREYTAIAHTLHLLQHSLMQPHRLF